MHLATYLGGEHHLILGCGTALIARWEHRWTHDLDSFIEAGPYARLQENRIAFERDLRTVRRIREVNVRPHNALILVEDGGEITIATTPAFTGNPRSVDTVRGTAVALETSAEILAKKIGGRILRNNTFVPRDLYDLAIARRSEPDALARAPLLHTGPPAADRRRTRSSALRLDGHAPGPCRRTLGSGRSPVRSQDRPDDAGPAAAAALNGGAV